MIVYFKDVKNIFQGNQMMGKFHKVCGEITPFTPAAGYATSGPSVSVPLSYKGRTYGYNIELKNVIIYDFKRYYDTANRRK